MGFIFRPPPRATADETLAVACVAIRTSIALTRLDHVGAGFDGIVAAVHDDVLDEEVDSFIDVDVLLGRGSEPSEEPVLFAVIVHHLLAKGRLHEIALVGQKHDGERVTVGEPDFLLYCESQVSHSSSLSG